MILEIQKAIARLFGHLFTKALGRSFNKAIPENKWVVTGANLFGAFWVGVLLFIANVIDDEGVDPFKGWFFAVLGTICLIGSLLFMLKGFSEGLGDREET